MYAGVFVSTNFGEVNTEIDELKTLGSDIKYKEGRKDNLSVNVNNLKDRKTRLHSRTS